MSPLMRPTVALVALALLGGCASTQYVYSPEENATARVQGHPAALYQIPPEAPEGTVRVATLGIAKLALARPEGYVHVRALHVRMVVDDNGDEPWTFDTREQIAVLPGRGQSRAAWVSSSIGQPPLVQIPPGASATLDLYYPLPRAMQDASEIPGVQVVWRVQTPQRVVAERTSFERLKVEPAPTPAYAWGTGWWGPGWYDPFWPDYTFYGPAVVVPGPVWVERRGVTAPQPAHPIR